MGALHLPLKDRDTSHCTSSLLAPAELRPLGLQRTKAPSCVRNFAMILVIGMLVSVVLAEGASSPSQLEQSAESESEVDFKTAKLISSRCTEDLLYAKGSEYHFNVKFLFLKLIEGIKVGAEAWEDASDFYDNSNTVYGLAGCTNLTPEGCKVCLSHIVTNLEAGLEGWCPHPSLKAEIVLDSCFLRYDNYYLKVPLKESLRAAQH